MNKERFVQNIEYFCKIKGVRRTTACRESGVGTSFVNDIMRGQTPSVAKVQQLAEYLGVTTSQLLGEDVSKLDTAANVSNLDTRELSEAEKLFAALPEDKQDLILALMRGMTKGE